MIRMLAAILVGTGVWMLVAHWASYMHVGSGLDGAVVQTSSAIPMYAIWLLSVVCLVLMSTKVVRCKWAKHSRAA
jgi:hypothetical protein